jgi:hypothetical protein
MKLKHPKSFDELIDNKEDWVHTINAATTYMELCCSTGILKQVRATHPAEHDRPAFEDNSKFDNLDKDKINPSNNNYTVHQLIRGAQVASRPMFFPIEVAAWHSLSLMYVKHLDGTDDSGNTAYGGYKAAQFIMADRVTEDKLDKNFRFAGAYNTVFSVDHMIDWLLANCDKYKLGIIHVSEARPGGHKAKVRTAMFEPSEAGCALFLETRKKLLRDYINKMVQLASSKTQDEAVDSIAASW